MIEKFFLAFIPIFVAIDPIGLVAIFTGLAASSSPEQRKRQGFLGIFTALCVAVGFMFLGGDYFRRTWNHGCGLSSRRWSNSACSGRPGIA